MTGSSSAGQARDYLKRHDRVRVQEAHNSTIHSVSWSCDGRRLATGSVDKVVGVWQLEGAKLRTHSICQGHSDQVDQVSWHPSNPEILASASGDRSVRIWDVRSKKGNSNISTKGQNINVCWSPDGEVLGVGDKDDRVTIIDMRTLKQRHQEQFKFETNEFVWDPTSKFLFISSGHGYVYIYKWPEMKLHLTLQAHPPAAICLSIKIDPQGKHFAIGGGDALISLWDLKHLTCMRTIDRLEYPVRTVSFSHDGKLLAAGSEDHCVDISWANTAERVHDLKCDGETYTLAWHPKQYLLAFACDDSSRRSEGKIRLFGFSPDQL